jgi:dUTP pyrophosphatase
MIKLERFRNRLVTVLDAPFKVNIGDRIAQGIILPVPRVSFIETEELSETARGIGGFGSTGA